MSKSQFRWKGRLMSEKQYKHQLTKIENGTRRKKSRTVSEKQCVIRGRRIVELQVMGQHMHCTSCEALLSLENIEGENRRGLASIFSVRCRKCLLMNNVPSGTQHPGPKTDCWFDVNSKAVAGTLHAGLGYSTVNKVLQTMDVPNMSSKTFKRHEREMGPVIEDVAKESCKEATNIERSLTLENMESLQKLLPEGFQTGFLVPRRTDSSISSIPSTSTNELAPTEVSKLLSTPPEALEIPIATEISVSSKTITPSESPSPVAELPDKSQVDSVTFDDVVRLFVSYDMGWSKRGSGHQYDSLNGYSAIMGTQSGLVLDFTTRNRQCRRCDLGIPKNKHDCRLNSYGSAKSMEPDAAAQLVARSDILTEKNCEVAVFVGDNDSSSICAVRNASNHTIIKQSDKNHTSRGVTNMLYKIDRKTDPNKEMSAEAIKYLHRCFTYAMAQNRGHVKKMAAAVRNIPFHAYNQHSNCGEWCGYLQDPENYAHTTIFGGFQSKTLFEKLKELFGKLADNADKFAAGASSQGNESLNGVMSRKAPKAICYSLSESADYRYACAVGQKNRGEQYVQDAFKTVQMSPGSHLAKHVERTMKSARLRSLKAKTPAFKRQRQFLRKQRTQLRNRRDLIEGETYRSHIGLLEMPAVEEARDTGLLELSQNVDAEVDNQPKAIVFFDLETSGLNLNCDVLQISMKCGNSTFNEYITPTQRIPLPASKVHGLTNENKQLFLHGKMVPSQPLRIVVGEVLQFLQKFDKPCILIAHNCAFDAPRMLRIISQTGLTEEFEGVVEGFSDTLPLYRKKFPGEDCSLTALAARNFRLSAEKAHDAAYDVLMLQNVALHNFAIEELLDAKKCFVHMVRSTENYRSLEPLQNIISKEMRKRMADAGISYVLLVDTFRKGQKSAIDLLEKKANGKKQVVKTKKILNNILEHLAGSLQ